MKKTIIYITILLILATFVSADYTAWYSYGGNAQQSNHITGIGNGLSGYPINVTGENSGGGTDAQPLVIDYGNGAHYVFMDEASEVAALYDSETLVKVWGVAIGELSAQPTLCDLNGDGVKEIVGVSKHLNNYYAFAIGKYATTFQVIDVVDTDSTNISANIVCSRLDNTVYSAWWIDNAHYIHKLSLSGSTLTDTKRDVETSVSRSAANYFNRGDYSLVESNGFCGGSRALTWVSGKYLTTYWDDDALLNYAASIELTNTLWNISGTESMVGLMSDVDYGGAQDGVMVYQRVGATGSYNYYALYGCTYDYFNGYSLQLRYLQHPEVSLTGLSSLTISKLHTTSHDWNLVYTITTTGVAGAWYAGAIAAQNGSVSTNQGAVETSATGAGGTAYTFSNPTYDDLLLNAGGVIYLIDFQNFTNPTTHVARNNAQPTEYYKNAPLLVDLDSDGVLDWLYHSSKTTWAALSGGAVIEYNPSIYFDVALNTSWSFASATKQEITQTNYATNPQDSYGYALICDLSQGALWSESFGIGYNATARNVTLNPSANFTIAGALYNNAGGFDGNPVDIKKTGNTAYSGNLVLTINYNLQRGGDNDSLQILTLDGNNVPSSYTEIDRNGTHNEIYNLKTGSKYLVGTYPYTIGTEQIEITFTQKINVTSNKKYYNATLYDAGANKTVSWNTNAVGETIKSVELYGELHTDDVLSVNYISLERSSTQSANFTSFVNVAGPIIPQTGYSIIPEGDGHFSTVCQYYDAGTYYQRHFLSNYANPSYDNYVNIAVTVYNSTSILSGNNTGVGGGVGSGSTSSNGIITDIASNLNITYGNASLIMCLIVIVIAMVAAAVWIHPIVGALILGVGLIIGYILGMIPMWIVVVLIIFDAAAVALVAKNIFFSGSSGGD